MRRLPIKRDTAPIKQNAVVRGEASEVPKFPARYRKAINVPPRGLGHYHWNTDLQRIVDEGLMKTGHAVLTAEVSGANFTHERETRRLA